MTLRKRVGLGYGAIVAASLLLLAALGYHEFVSEPRQRAALGIPERPELIWSEYAEYAIYAMIPLILAGGWWLMRGTLAPVDALAQQVERISAANLCQVLPRTFNGDELDRLSIAFNAMIARLDGSFQQIRHFTLHASHELKTPLTVMWLQLDTILQNRDSLTHDQRESLECQLNEVQRLGRIVDALTLLAKADQGLVQLRKQPVRFDELVREAYEDAEVLAEREQVKVMLRRCDEVTMSADRDRLRQLLLNLLDNAIKYNRPGGLVSLELRCHDQTVELQVDNTGDGISPELTTRLFQRFVRGEAARSKAIEGCGLGLSICQWIVQAHQGCLRLSSAPDGTTTALAQWPSAGGLLNRPALE